MAYIDQNPEQRRSVALIGVIAIHTALGFVLVTGLAGKIPELVDPPAPPKAINVPLDPPPPKPPEPAVEKQQQQQSTQIYTPPMAFVIESDPPIVDTTSILPPASEPIVPNVVPTTTPAPPGNLAPLADPITPSPRNDAGRWITDADYRSIWINRGYEGLATFRVTVGTNGRAQDCMLVRSTGHAALDDATCRLVKRRARFIAARDAQGNKVTGSFTSSVQWQLPE